MFCDQTNITVTAGKGGDGLISFRRERGFAKGGPDGGDGGRGGDVIIRANENVDTLLELHTKKKFAAQKGEAGGPQKMHGASAEDLVLRVPVGTQVFDKANNALMADLSVHGDECVAAVGGRGGYGNWHFKSSVRQTPRFAELGEPGESYDLHLELKLVADIGVIGLPSAGKSTLLSTCTSATPKIGDFPFTTLVPQLGVAKLSGERSLVMCDLPGLIEGASQGKGLGHDFLQHISRNRVLIHLVDITSENPAKDYLIIRNELQQYLPELLQKPEIIAFSKIDAISNDTEYIQMFTEDFLEQTQLKAPHLHFLSSVSHTGINELLEKAYQLNHKEKEREKKEHPQVERERIIFRPHLIKNPKAFTITPEEEGFRISGKRIEQIAVMSDFGNREAILRVRDVLRKMGIETKLLSMGAEEGTMLYFGKKELVFQPDVLRPKKKGECIKKPIKYTK
jgi:GTP-binding protein